MLLSNLANVLRAAGVPVVEVDGWQNRGYAGQDLASVDGVLWHHTVASRSSFGSWDAPSLQICTFGRSDLAGPLCHIVLGRSGTAYITAAGLANHAGRGSAHGIPTDQGNYRLIGIEMESSGVAPWDWTPAQVAIAPVIGAALEKAYLLDQQEEYRLQLAHAEYSSEGKIDPAGWPGGMDGLRASINELLAGGTVIEPVPVQPKPAPVTQSRPGGYEECVVEKGDTLWSIARQFNVEFPALLSVNPQITNKNVLEVGDVLNLPKGATSQEVTECIVDPGDTLNGIAKQYGVDAGELARINGLSNPNLIRPGQVLQLPRKGAAPAPAPAAPAVPAGLPPYCFVDPGDTISGIAAQYGVTVQYLLSKNPQVTDPNRIGVGQRLELV